MAGLRLYGNAPIESMFNSLKNEWVHGACQAARAQPFRKYDLSWFVRIAIYRTVCATAQIHHFYKRILRSYDRVNSDLDP
jgi:hypothetical protein